jgi:hypothetical protein
MENSHSQAGQNGNWLMGLVHCHCALDEIGNRDPDSPYSLTG